MRRYVMGGGLAIALAVAGFYLWSERREASRVEAQATPPPSKPSASGVAASLYFPARSANTLDVYSVDLPDVRADVREWARILLAALTRPPSEAALPVYPPGKEPRDIYLGEDRTLYIDFPQPPAPESDRGVGFEMRVVEAMLRTLAQNVEEVEWVKILVAGKDADRFARHVWMRAPFDLKPFRSVVK